jgi:hypothetical protein
MYDSPTPAHGRRSSYRQDLRTLTYVTLDAANGGILRNLNSRGVAVQAVSPLHENQRIRLRFDLRFPRLRVDAYGHVTWANAGGQCGVQFVDLPAQTRRQVDEWVFSNLLEAIARAAAQPNSIFAPADQARPGVAAKVAQRLEQSVTQRVAHEERLVPAASPIKDGLKKPASPPADTVITTGSGALTAELDAEKARPIWLSGKALARMVDGLTVFAGWLLFALTFLSLAKELPQWPLALIAGFGAAGFVAAAYWGMFAIFGGESLGTRLAGRSLPGA